MERKIEGLILKKSPYGERHIISDLLLRSGKRVTVTFYGGQGGGKKKKSSVLELGQLISVELNQKNRMGDVYAAKEWLPKWTYEKIRTNYKAFYTTCAFLEIVLKLSDHTDLKDTYHGSDTTDEGFFRVLSNSVFHMEKHLGEGEVFYPKTHLAYFLIKLILDLGIYPIREECILSGEEINPDDKVVLLPDQGGFGKLELVREQQKVEGSTFLWKLLGHVWSTPFKQLDYDLIVPDESLNLLIDYFCYQLGINRGEIKSLALLM